ncbi:hypothetical protein ACKWTF_003215 [Chironomus riparius]
MSYDGLVSLQCAEHASGSDPTMKYEMSKRTERTKMSKRTERINPIAKKPKLELKVWNNELHFSKKEIPMRLAEIASTRSKFENNKVGACIVDDEYRVLGYGYNGYPRLRKGENNEKYNARENKILYKCCAAQNAIHHSTSSVRKATLSAKTIIQSEIKRVVYLESETHHPNKNHKVSEDILKDYLDKNLMTFAELMQDKQYVFKPLTLLS